MANDNSASSPINAEASIDYEILKSEIRDKGPIRFSKPNFPIETYISIQPCNCSMDMCPNDVIVIRRVSGLSRMQWLLEPDDLMKFDSLKQLADQIFHFGLEDSRGERLVMESAIERHLNVHYQEVDELFCTCKGCLENFPSEDIWRQVLLRNMAFNLQQRKEWKEFIGDADKIEIGQEGVSFDDVFELGFATARIFSEFILKAEVEPQAIAGIKAHEDQQKRAAAAGKNSSIKRHKRITDLLSKMEELARRNPDIVRLGQEALANLALNDAMKQSPKLWKQGKGRQAEYLDEMKVDVRYRDRFRAIFHKSV